MQEAAYREALMECADRYIKMAEPGSKLFDFVCEFRHKIDGKPVAGYLVESDPFPLLKLNRWLGYIQGVLIEQGRTDVETERDWTRPLFRPLDFTEQPGLNTPQPRVSVVYGAFRASDYRSLHNEIVIVHDYRMGRLIGIHQDIMDSYYVILHMREPEAPEPNIRRYSAVGGCESMRCVNRYEQIENAHTLNGAPPQEKFLITRQCKEYQNEWYFRDPSSDF
jgi:hypothetical protein